MNELPENIILAQKRLEDAEANMGQAIRDTFREGRRITWRYRGRARVGEVCYVEAAEWVGGSRLVVKRDDCQREYWIYINSAFCPRPVKTPD